MPFVQSNGYDVERNVLDNVRFEYFTAVSVKSTVLVERDAVWLLLQPKRLEFRIRRL